MPYPYKFRFCFFSEWFLKVKSPSIQFLLFKKHSEHTREKTFCHAHSRLCLLALLSAFQNPLKRIDYIFSNIY